MDAISCAQCVLSAEARRFNSFPRCSISEFNSPLKFRLSYRQRGLKLTNMGTNFFLTIIIAVIITAVFCYVGYVVTKRMILKFISSIKQAIEEIDTQPDETSSRVRYEMSDRVYNDMLMRELRKDSMQARTLAGKPVNFRIVEDPGKIKSDEIIFMQ